MQQLRAACGPRHVPVRLFITTKSVPPPTVLAPTFDRPSQLAPRWSDTPRNRELQRIYAKYHAAPDQATADALAASGGLFNAEWRPFRDRSDVHARFSVGRKLPTIHASRPYRIDADLVRIGR